jgi:hypothetical protein
MSYELRHTTILEAEIDVLREQLTRAKEENIKLRAKIGQADIDRLTKKEKHSSKKSNIVPKTPVKAVRKK